MIVYENMYELKGITANIISICTKRMYKVCSSVFAVFQRLFHHTVRKNKQTSLNDFYLIKYWQLIHY